MKFHVVCVLVFTIFSCKNINYNLEAKINTSGRLNPLLVNHITNDESKYIDQYNIANNLYYDNNSKQAVIVLDEMLRDCKNKYILSEVNALRLKCLSSSESNDTYAKNIIPIWTFDEYQKKTYIEKYYYIQILIEYASYIINNGSYEDAIILVDYSIQLIELFNDQEATLQLEEKAKLEHAKLLLIDNPKNYSIAKSSLDKLISQSASSEILFRSLLNISNINTLSKEEVDDYLARAFTISQELSKKHKEIYYSHLGAILLARNENTKGREALQIANSFYPYNTCHKFKSINILYIAQTYLEENIDSTNHYLNLAINTSDCTKHTSNLIRFYSEFIKLQLLTNKNENTFSNEILQTLLNERMLSNNIFTEKYTLHEYDYKSQNTNNILSQYHHKKSLDYKKDIDIVKYINETKTLKWKSNFSATKRTQLNLLEEIKRNRDDFKSEKKTLVENVSKQNFYINTYILPNKIHSINQQDLDSSIHLIPTLEFFNFNENLWFYLLTKNKLQLNLISNKSISLKDQFLNSPIYKSIEKMEKLNIINDGNSQQIPFQVLFSNLDISNSNITSLNSKSNLSISNSTVIAYSNDESTRSLNKKTIPEIPNSYLEANSIFTILSAKELHSGYECSVENFYSSMSSDILHIATHAYSDSIHRLESYIILRDSLGQPTRLYADEILSMPTVPKFVNLSACQTGTGVHMAGAGTYSIARSFLQKGSEAVMKTLWDVDDQATKEFMIMFYTKWKDGLSCGEALRETKQVFKSSKNYSDPTYWAGFILEGNPNLYISKN